MNDNGDRGKVLSSLDCGVVRIPSEADKKAEKNSIDDNTCVWCGGEIVKSGSKRVYVEIKGDGFVSAGIHIRCIDEVKEWIQDPRNEEPPSDLVEFKQAPDSTLDSNCIVCCQDSCASYFLIYRGSGIRFHEKCRQAILNGLDECFAHTDILLSDAFD